MTMAHYLLRHVVQVPHLFEKHSIYLFVFVIYIFFSMLYFLESRLFILIILHRKINNSRYP